LREIPFLVAAQHIPGALARMAATSLLFLVLYLAAIIALHGGPEPLYRFARLLPEMLPLAKSRVSPASPQGALLGPESAPEDAVAVSERFTP
jgi:hypothetical protein